MKRLEYLTLVIDTFKTRTSAAQIKLRIKYVEYRIPKDFRNITAQKDDEPRKSTTSTESFTSVEKDQYWGTIPPPVISLNTLTFIYGPLKTGSHAGTTEQVNVNRRLNISLRSNTNARCNVVSFLNSGTLATVYANRKKGSKCSPLK